MHKVRVVLLVASFMCGKETCSMGKDINKPQNETEWSLQDARWALNECKKDYALYQQQSPQNSSSLRGLLSSYWNVVGLTATPGLFVGLHVVKCVGVITLLKAFHAFSGVPETEESQHIELLIAAAYPLSETLYTTWSNRHRKF